VRGTIASVPAALCGGSTVSACARVRVCVRAYVRTCVHVCVCVYVCMYANTGTTKWNVNSSHSHPPLSKTPPSNLNSSHSYPPPPSRSLPLPLLSTSPLLLAPSNYAVRTGKAERLCPCCKQPVYTVFCRTTPDGTVHASVEPSRITHSILSGVCVRPLSLSLSLSLPLSLSHTHTLARARTHTHTHTHTLETARPRDTKDTSAAAVHRGGNRGQNGGVARTQRQVAIRTSFSYM